MDARFDSGEIMKTAQQRIIEQIENAIGADFGLSCAQVSAYSNTGSILIYSNEDATTAFGSVAYDFQSSTYKLSITLRGRKIASQIGRADYFDFYQEYEQATRFWDALTEALNAERFCKSSNVSDARSTRVRTAKTKS